jgi:hypothetical protein
MKHGAGRWAMHPVEVIAMAREMAGNVPATVPEERYLEPAAKPGSRDALTVALLGLGIAGLCIGSRVCRWL